MNPLYDYGNEVRVIRNVRNDGSFPGKDRGDLLIRRGQVGHVRNIGTFLQDQIIYTVHFVEEDLQVGCREEELQLASDPWVPSRFESREKVVTSMALSLRGEVVVQPGDKGEILKVERDDPQGVYYHVLFPGHVLAVPENALEAPEEEKELVDDFSD
ncbi:nitrogen fixation protein NifZ [Marinospirillum perlucidum]|uniref:nitrogen fixation protein NifZ n=1 Tax=Marinospirillum perlucidum TaxID=1982602 RepID=UPI000DF1FEF0|nr:nitrogen fixation protein NifZ [Marinospirillum perlucidum]